MNDDVVASGLLSRRTEGDPAVSASAERREHHVSSRLHEVVVVLQGCEQRAVAHQHLPNRPRRKRHEPQGEPSVSPVAAQLR